MPIAHCRECGKIMSNDLREFDDSINKAKIFCRKCRSNYRKKNNPVNREPCEGVKQ